jgi:uridine kinase
MAYQLSEINQRIREDTPGFLAECDGAYKMKVARAADRIIANLDRSRIVLLSGPSGSGKTTTALKIEEELKSRGIVSHTISMDNYFVTCNPKTAPRTEEGDIDYESPLLLDMELLVTHFQNLERGEEIVVPKFEFARQMRSVNLGTRLHLQENEVAIFEGIHALNDSIAGRHPEATTLYISARSNVCEGDLLRFKGTWMRLVRRLVRDYNFRGTDIVTTLDMWANVRRGEKLFISPFKNRAKIVFDSSLPYEVSVMRHYAKPIFDAVPKENQRRHEMLELVDAFQHFEPIDPVLLAPDSLLREFIGGSTYQY